MRLAGLARPTVSKLIDGDEGLMRKMALAAAQFVETLDLLDAGFGLGQSAGEFAGMRLGTLEQRSSMIEDLGDNQAASMVQVPLRPSFGVTAGMLGGDVVGGARSGGERVEKPSVRAAEKNGQSPMVASFDCFGGDAGGAEQDNAVEEAKWHAQHELVSCPHDQASWSIPSHWAGSWM